MNVYKALLHFFLLAFVLTTTVLTTNRAHADSYIGFGVGSGAKVSGPLERIIQADDQPNGRLFIGQRISALAVEASLFGTGLATDAESLVVNGPSQTLSLGASLKYHFPLALGLDVFVRGGIHKTWIGRDTIRNQLEFEEGGNGFHYGGGLQYKFPTPLLHFALHAEIVNQRLSTDDPSGVELDGDITSWNIGASIGF